MIIVTTSCSKSTVFKMFNHHVCSAKLFNSMSETFKVFLCACSSGRLSILRSCFIELIPQSLPNRYFLNFKETNNVINRLNHPLSIDRRLLFLVLPLFRLPCRFHLNACLVVLAFGLLRNNLITSLQTNHPEKFKFPAHCSPLLTMLQSSSRIMLNM